MTFVVGILTLLSKIRNKLIDQFLSLQWNVSGAILLEWMELQWWVSKGNQGGWQTGYLTDFTFRTSNVIQPEPRAFFQCNGKDSL